MINMVLTGCGVAPKVTASSELESALRDTHTSLTFYHRRGHPSVSQDFLHRTGVSVFSYWDVSYVGTGMIPHRYPRTPGVLSVLLQDFLSARYAYIGLRRTSDGLR